MRSGLSVTARSATSCAGDCRRKAVSVTGKLEFEGHETPGDAEHDHAGAGRSRGKEALL